MPLTPNPVKLVFHTIQNLSSREASLTLPAPEKGLERYLLSPFVLSRVHDKTVQENYLRGCGTRKAFKLLNSVSDYLPGMIHMSSEHLLEVFARAFERRSWYKHVNKLQVGYRADTVTTKHL